METSQDVQNLYKVIVKSLKSGMFDTPEEVIAAYNALSNINTQLSTIEELKGRIVELEKKPKK